ncbi:cysteine/O-acetylserine exporter [Budvicia aquatica]|uniref:Cysteine/O-acetylserine exporter n=1 Tax=Budvicia aquatica TaxID=82979 RepID=A0A484ZDH4_9GAMM|nr:cysteine/O-acetylserine exporter [Budvicia aquatica]
MELGWFLSMLMFLWIAAVTPGPNNMLLTSSTANFGFIRTLPLMLGIMIGMQLLLLLVAAGVGSIIIAYPPIAFSPQDFRQFIFGLAGMEDCDFPL